MAEGDLMDWNFADAMVDVAENITELMASSWGAVGAPGAWWTGSQRADMVREVRAARMCRLCADRKEALVPMTVDGRHEAATGLPADVVELVHRLTTDASRITQVWAQDRISALEAAPYAEIVGITAIIHMVDVFCVAVGSDVPAPPAEQLGEPSRELPHGLDDIETAYVPQIRMPTANVGRALTIVPDTLASFFQLERPLYTSGTEFTRLVWGDRALDRPQVELLAARTSALNECFY
jgi:hypothetical protein